MSRPLRSNPFKSQVIGDTYVRALRDVYNLAGRYATVPLSALKNSRALNTALREVKAVVAPKVVYAIKIGTGISQDAFLDMQDALGVAQAVANKHNLRVSVVNKATGTTAKTVGSSRKTASSYLSNPSSETLGKYYIVDGMTERVFKTPREAYSAAQRIANDTGKKVKVMYDPSLYGDPRRKGTAKPRTMRANPARPWNTTYYQDGADFYWEAPKHDGGHVWTAPFKVLDFDMKAADRARKAFLNHMALKGQSVKWSK